MAGETLRTATQLLAEFPDNTAGLIDAVQSRNMIVSELLGVGFMEDNTAAFTVTIQDGVFVSINAAVTPQPIIAANFAWDIDGNNAWFPDYVNNGVTVPAGVIRLHGMTSTILVTKPGGGSAIYSFQYFIAGVPFGNPVSVSLDATPSILPQSDETLSEVALGETIDWRVSGVGTAEDLSILDFRQRVTSALI